MKPIYLILIVIVLIIVLVYYNKQTTTVAGGMDGAINNFVEGPTTGGVSPTEAKCREVTHTVYTTMRKCSKKKDDANVLNTHFTKRKNIWGTRWGDCDVIMKVC